MTDRCTCHDTDQCACCSGKDDDWLGHIESMVAQNYWRVVMVMAGTKDDEPPFAYSTGLTSQGKPELIIYGLQLETARDVINDVGQRLADGEPISSGSRLSGVLVDRDVIMIGVADASDMTETGVFYRHQFTALQIVFPDSHNRFPWEAGHALAPGRQPLMGHAPDCDAADSA